VSLRQTLRRELNAVGDYRSVWSHTADVERLKAQDLGRWYPDTRDFLEMARKGQRRNDKLIRVAKHYDLLAQLGKTGREKPESISRLNIFTHGSDLGEVVMQGRVTSDDVIWGLADLIDGGFDENLFYAVKQQGTTFGLRGSKAQYSIEDVRRAFSKDGEVVLYACHSGVDKGYLGKMAEVFGVPVTGFTQSVRYRLRAAKGSTEATYGLVGLPVETSNFHDLDPYRASSP
jgi:hypothetical protein